MIQQIQHLMGLEITTISKSVFRSINSISEKSRKIEQCFIGGIVQSFFCGVK